LESWALGHRLLPKGAGVLPKIDYRRQGMEQKQAKLGGWKTKVGIGLLTGATIARIIGHPEIAETLMLAGGIMGFWGVGHKVEKALNGKSKPE